MITQPLPRAATAFERMVLTMAAHEAGHGTIYALFGVPAEAAVDISESGDLLGASLDFRVKA
jgi:hypothetical protein